MLIKGMFENRETARFGLLSSQCGNDDVSHNGGWYNEHGEKLGWGDLSVAQVQRLMAELAPDETFIVLSEGDSYWNFVKDAQLDARKNVVEPEEKSPGVKYMVEHARLIIKRGRAYFIYFQEEEENPDYEFRKGLKVHLLPRSKVSSVLGVV